MHQPTRFLSRKQAAAHLAERGLSVAVATLAKYAVIGGGPVFRLFGRLPRYTVEELDRWAESRLSAPQRHTSEAPKEATARRRGRPRKGEPASGAGDAAALEERAW
jgi:hypothetical protein